MTKRKLYVDEEIENKLEISKVIFVFYIPMTFPFDFSSFLLKYSIINRSLCI